MITKLKLFRLIVLFNLVASSVLGQNCDKTSSSNYRCLDKNPDAKCKTYAILRANSHYSSLSNLTSSFTIARAELLEANGFTDEVEFLSEDQPVLIPIECKCSRGGFYGAELQKISVKGESFYDIADSLEGLTSCNEILEKNPSFSPWNVPEGVFVSVPVRCSCPVSTDSRKFLVSYPVKGGDTLVELAEEFNVSVETLVSANMMYSTPGFRQDGNLVQDQTLLIPLEERLNLGGFGLGGREESIRVRNSHKRRKKPRKWTIGVYVGIGVVGFLTCIGVGAAIFFFTKLRREKEMGLNLTKNGSVDLEVQHLSLSIRTTSDKKVSFEGSQYNFDEPNYTPHKMRVESFTYEDLQKATEDFSSSNLIEGSVFHGRFKGKNMAIKRVSSETISRIDYQFHRHPNIMRMLGTCSGEGMDSYIVFEYAKNGSLKDWIHGGLAMKSHFVASCSCFLTWDQRVRICADVATALQHMHLVMNPSYVHRHIKSRNIFLDEDFSAKVGNFGLAKLADHDHHHHPSTVWDKGYLPPEYLAEGIISPSTDIFAFGVVLLEVLSGKPPVRQAEENEDGGDKYVTLSDEIKGILESENAEELRGWIDGALGDKYSFDGAVMLANLARSCVEDEASSRPNAGEIVEKLLRLVEELPDGDQVIVCESSCKPLVTKEM